MMINKAYLAGVIDSDGSITITKRNVKRPNPSYQGILQLTWTHNKKTREFIENLVSVYGGSFFIGDSAKNRFKNGKPIIKYMITTNNLTPLLADIYPFLVLKRKQAINAMRLDKLNIYCRSCGHGRPKPQKIKDIQERIYLNNLRLNK